jgi:hypothetical protein
MPIVPIASPWISTWIPRVDLGSPAGRLVRELVGLVPEGSRITLFGSAPLQLTIDSSFLSEDLDCFEFSSSALNLKELVEKHGLGKTAHDPYVQVCDRLNFNASPDWLARAYFLPLDGRIVVIPHPIDILIGKLHRMAEKDIKAFKIVREKTGHPTEEEMLGVLRDAVDLYRPGYDEEQRGDLKTTTRILWREVFGRDINVAAEIIAPAQERRRRMYVEDRPATDYKASLENLGKLAPPQRGTGT